MSETLKFLSLSLRFSLSPKPQLEAENLSSVGVAVLVLPKAVGLLCVQVYYINIGSELTNL